MFCAFVWIGTIFVFFFGILIAYDEWFGAMSVERDEEQKAWLQLNQAVGPQPTTLLKLTDVFSSAHSAQQHTDETVVVDKLPSRTDRIRST